jgi:outer membrane protein
MKNTISNFVSSVKIKDAVIFLSLGILGWMSYSNSNGKQRIAYMDVTRVFNEFNLKKELQKKYIDQMSGQKKMIDSLGFLVQRMGVDLENTSTPDSVKMNRFLLKRKQYMTMVREYDDQDKKLNNQYDGQILAQMNEYIKEYGEENGFDLILGSMGNGNIMQGSQRMDVTTEVVKFINKKYEGIK